MDALLHLIHDIWNVRIHPHGKDACATTCLLAAALPDGRLVMAQLGDGMLMLKRPGGIAIVLAPNRDNGFANETTGLGLATSLNQWHWHIETGVAAGTSLLLLSDGIAEDLLPETLTDFPDFVRQEYVSLDRGKRGRKLVSDLRRWPVPRHGDDKTLAFMWMEAGGRNGDA